MVAMYPHYPRYAKCVGFARILDGVDNTASAASMFGVKAAIKADTKHIMKSWANIIRYMCGDVFWMWWWFLWCTPACSVTMHLFIHTTVL